MVIRIKIWSVTCVKFISILLSLGLILEEADYASILIDIDSVILEISSESLFISII